MEQATAAPKVSICSQIRNQCDWAREMIESVRASTFADWELIIVDDCSTEDLKSVVTGFSDNRIRYFRFEKHRGVPAGTNLAIQMANGKYICLMAADEVITKEKLAEQVEYLEAAHKAGAFVCVAFGCDAAWQAFREWVQKTNHPAHNQ